MAKSRVTTERFRQCQKFIRDCCKTSKVDLLRKELPEMSSYYLTEMMMELSRVVAELVEIGDLQIARHLLAVMKNYNRALSVNGPFICPEDFAGQGIHQILEKHSAHAVFAMVKALNPQWHLCCGNQRQKIESLKENELRSLLLSPVKSNSGDGKAKHPLAELVENVFTMHENESKRINLFVAYLRSGWLWSLGGKNGKLFKKCPWLGRVDLPPIENWKAWKKMISDFLREVTDGDASRLSVFRTFLVVRNAVYAKVGKNELPCGPLVNDRPEIIWNQIETRIGKAWKTMLRKPIKRKRVSQTSGIRVVRA